MTKQQILDACKTEYAQFLVDIETKPEDMSLSGQMIFQAAFVRGWQRGMEETEQMFVRAEVAKLTVVKT